MSRFSYLFSRIQHFDLLHQSLSDGLKIRQDGCYVGYDLCLALFRLRTKKQPLKQQRQKLSPQPNCCLTNKEA